MTMNNRVTLRRDRHGQALTPRYIMGTDCSCVSSTPAPAQGGPALARRSPVSYGHPVRPALWDALVPVTPRIGVREWRDLLATLAAVAGARDLGAGPPHAAGRAAVRRRARLVARRNRFGRQSGRLGGAHTGPNPTDRATAGIKRHVLSDGQGTPLALQITPANVHDTTQALPLLDAIPPTPGPRGRPCQRPLRLQGDRAYGSAANRRGCRRRHVCPQLAAPRQPHGSGLGKTRWVSERTHAWSAQFRRLRVCYERTQLSTLAFHLVATILLVWNAIQRL
jgi:transposase